jgi:hypothetical protein
MAPAAQVNAARVDNVIKRRKFHPLENMIMSTLKDVFDDAVRQGMIMSLGPNGQVTMAGPREVSLALNRAIVGQEDLFVTLLCEHLNWRSRNAFAVEGAEALDVRDDQAGAWLAAGACIGRARDKAGLIA